MVTASEYVAGFKKRHAAPKRPPINWRKKYEAERALVINEAIVALRCEMRKRLAIPPCVITRCNRPQSARYVEGRSICSGLDCMVHEWFRSCSL